MEKSFLRSREEILAEFQVDIQQGLSQQKADEQLKKYGRNGE